MLNRIARMSQSSRDDSVILNVAFTILLFELGECFDEKCFDFLIENIPISRVTVSCIEEEIARAG